VKFQALPSTLNPQLSTSFLAESYYLQSRSKLDGALAAAREAVRIAPNFAFGWCGGGIGFGFGHITAARDAVEKSLRLRLQC